MRHFTLIVLVLAAALAAAPNGAAHKGECVVAAHLLEADLHLECGHGKEPCLTSIQYSWGDDDDDEGGDDDEQEVGVFGGCGFGGWGNCVVDIREDGLRIILCHP